MNDQIPVLPLRLIHQTWEARQSKRGFILYCLTVLTWVWLQHLRADAMFAYDTYRVYTLAEKTSLAAPYSAIESSGELIEFVERGLTDVMNTMAETHDDAICPNCEVGLTPASGDMVNLTLADFICSDFDSQAGSSEYPVRNCEAAD